MTDAKEREAFEAKDWLNTNYAAREVFRREMVVGIVQAAYSAGLASTAQRERRLRDCLQRLCGRYHKLPKRFDSDLLWDEVTEAERVLGGKVTCPTCGDAQSCLDCLRVERGAMSETERKCLDCGEPLTPVGFHMSIEDAQRCHAGHTQPAQSAAAADDPCTAQLKAEWRAAHPEAAPLPDEPGRPYTAQSFQFAMDWLAHYRVDSHTILTEAERHAACAEAYAASREQQVRELSAENLIAARNLAEARAQVKAQAQKWLHENSAKLQLLEENAELKAAVSEHEIIAENYGKQVRILNSEKGVLIEENARLRKLLRQAKGGIEGNIGRMKRELENAHGVLATALNGAIAQEGKVLLKIKAATSLTDRENLRPDGTRHKEGKK